jgi:hypothetical protein
MQTARQKFKLGDRVHHTVDGIDGTVEKFFRTGKDRDRYYFVVREYGQPVSTRAFALYWELGWLRDQQPQEENCCSPSPETIVTGSTFGLEVTEDKTSTKCPPAFVAFTEPPARSVGQWIRETKDKIVNWLLRG